MKTNELIIKDFVRGRPQTPADLAFLKRRASRKYRISCPSNIELLKAYHSLLENKSVKRTGTLEILLRTRPIRSLSGIVNVSVLTKPHPCPGKCVYCPTEKGIPKSYISGEPAVERAKRLKYDPFQQVARRLEMLELEGHPTDKVELRIVGGTWSYYPKKYQEWFIKRCLEACKPDQKIVGLSVETRPDFIDLEEIKRLRKLGVTRVELGVQSIDDAVLDLNLRGHSVQKTIEATKLLKDAGFKVSYQMMLSLPGSSPRKDLEMFRQIFSDPNFQPDLLKIYPCAILKEAPLYRWYLAGKYRPYPEKTLIKTIKEIKKILPYHVRVERITRDIPSSRIFAGPKKISNLRQALAKEIKKEGWTCHCIRCREIKKDYNPKEKLLLQREDYAASQGREIFLTFENAERTKLFSLLRLRIPADPYPRNLRGSAIIREVHTFGQLVPISEKKSAPQHQGLGKKLIARAEKIIQKEFRLSKISVIAAVGARGYFRGLGYKLRNAYMVKNFRL
ncbi:MAG: tRNA uridine(34) 5-carboxymethylaminomethyl modification radical SAM/GNAT enzyme Elp3 [Candidatus Nealsonbacteria bacterium]|nr:tRNA uridine(34) 5-carboxymethylaminomethyl modification radical SAM/GNAT enzyme Elp3 [Candidatus Nealsonbacteria bacterium]